MNRTHQTYKLHVLDRTHKTYKLQEHDRTHKTCGQPKGKLNM